MEHTPEPGSKPPTPDARGKDIAEPASASIAPESALGFAHQSPPLRAYVEALQRSVGNRATSGRVLDQRTLHRLKKSYGGLDAVAAVGRALADENEDDAHELMRKLTTAAQANAVLRSYQRAAVKCFGNKTMGIAAQILVSKGGSLRDALAWMEDEGTNWTLQSRVVAAATPDERKTINGHGWMKWWVKELGNSEMAALVKLLPLDLPTKLRWMHEEGTDWHLMKDVILSVPAADRPPIMEDDSIRAIFVDECGKSELYDAVKTLGGRLCLQLAWMAVRGCKDEWIRERADAVKDPQRRIEVYYEPLAWKRILKMEAADRAAIAKLLGGTPDQQLELFQNDVPISLLRWASTPSADWIAALMKYRKNPLDVLWIGSGAPAAWAPFIAPQLWNLLKDFHNTIYPEYNVKVFWEAYGNGAAFNAKQIMHFVGVVTGSEPFMPGPFPGKNVPGRAYVAVDPDDATAREFMDILKPGGSSGAPGISRSELAQGKLAFCYLDKSDPAKPTSFGSLFSDPWILIEVEPTGHGKIEHPGWDIPSDSAGTPTAVGTGLTYFQNHVRHEIGHAVGRSKIGKMKLSGNEFAVGYGGWKKSSRADFESALWSGVPRPGAGWPSVPILGTAVTLTNQDVHDWCIGIMANGKQPNNAIGNAAGDLQQKLTAIHGSLWSAVKLVNYMRAIGATGETRMRENAYQYTGFTPTDPVEIFATRWDNDFVHYDKVAHDNFMGISWYALSSPYEMFAEMYTACYAQKVLPAARPGWDPRAFFDELERQRDPMFGKP